LNYKEKKPTRSSAQLAVEAGYYDQSHMIDAFQQLVGLTPGSLW